MDLNNNLFIKLINNNTIIPSRATDNAAGLDLSSNENGFIEPQERKMISTGIIIKIPNNYYGRIAPRSGLALKNGIDVFAGVIDSDYRGEIKVILYNSDKEKLYEYKKGDRIAQLIIEKYYKMNVEQVEELEDKLEDYYNFRGDKCFGSSDLQK